MAGSGIYVNPLDRVPLAEPPPQPEAVTTTSAAPAIPGGVVAVIVLSLTTNTFVAACPPKLTVAPVEKFEPDSVTSVPPTAGPLWGATQVTVSGGGDPASKAMATSKGGRILPRVTCF